MILTKHLTQSRNKQKKFGIVHMGARIVTQKREKPLNGRGYVLSTLTVDHAKGQGLLSKHGRHE
jgi:hypothetical protein